MSFPSWCRLALGLLLLALAGWGDDDGAAWMPEGVSQDVVAYDDQRVMVA